MSNLAWLFQRTIELACPKSGCSCVNGFSLPLRERRQTTSSVALDCPGCNSQLMSCDCCGHFCLLEEGAESKPAFCTSCGFSSLRGKSSRMDEHFMVRLAHSPSCDPLANDLRQTLSLSPCGTWSPLQVRRLQRVANEYKYILSLDAQVDDLIRKILSGGE